MWRNEQNATPPTYRLIKSTDKGLSVASTAVTLPRAGAPSMVPGAFINFGRDNADHVDQYVYSVAGDWGKASPAYLVRVPLTQIENATAYEVFTGKPLPGCVPPPTR